MCDYPGSECRRNGCGHTFCSGCWGSHLAVQIREGKARHISCMAFKCGVVCDEDLVVNIIKVRGCVGENTRQLHTCPHSINHVVHAGGCVLGEGGGCSTRATACAGA